MTRTYAILAKLMSCMAAALLALALMAVPPAWADDPGNCESVTCPRGQECVNGNCQIITCWPNPSANNCQDQTQNFCALNTCTKNGHNCTCFWGTIESSACICP